MLLTTVGRKFLWAKLDYSSSWPALQRSQKGLFKICQKLKEIRDYIGTGPFLDEAGHPTNRRWQSRNI